MKTNYICPHCRGAINADNNIILSAKTKNNNVGLVLLHEEIGNYSSICSGSIKVKEKDIVDFFCPICHQSLNVKEDQNFAKYLRIDDNLEESWIIISREFGERITFKVDKNKHIETYGEKLSRFVDPEWFLKWTD